MGFTVLIVGLLGLLAAPGFAYTININGDSNVDGSGQQSVSINGVHNVANIDNNNGWDSWNSLWDYENSFAATRLFAKKSCIVHKMNKDAMPSLQDLDTLVKQQKGKGPEGASPKDLMYSINPTRVEDVNTFGPKIASMCRGIPTYVAEEIPGPNQPLYSKKCYTANILWILRMSFCETSVETY
ncbi:gastrokine 1 [Rattus norvegicus]|uniref:Gastrokine-1 n=2 Tax=Rattus norvegicus TaxID=10116 RepID=F7ETE6_RAT|nr:gastrokine-1 precursor [Rattus norvegicus]AAR21208.1 foveolin precursor [Rattus norvegicus]EDL91271.1 gastrokine 1 [Rattus norvegicus]DAA02295.1 TPA_inf: foveolin [Rattus norvegicus]|eukprot:NP_945323.1 gastrokine-1 precursor [Rattus norvegicus]